MVTFRLLSVFFFIFLCVTVFIEEAESHDITYPKSGDDQSTTNDKYPTVDSSVETEIDRVINKRSVKDSSKIDELSTKLDHLIAQINIIGNISKNLEAESKVARVEVGEQGCSRDKYSLGARYNSYSEAIKNQSLYPKNCKEVQENGNNVTGIYEIYPKYADAPFLVRCDMKTRGGGWTYIQRRFDGSQDFYLEWKDYKHGFGNLRGEFWLGLEKIHRMTNFEEMKLLVELVDRDNVSAYAEYNSFSVGPEPEGYKLTKLSGFSGDAGDSMVLHLGQKFSTKDLDFTGDYHCTGTFLGAWWYDMDTVKWYYGNRSNLNGKYINVEPNSYKYKGLEWKSFRELYSLSKSSMLIRPAN